MRHDKVGRKATGKPPNSRMPKRCTALARWLAAGILLTISAGQALAAGRAALVIDANTGQDLHGDNPDRPVYPASLTKMMTLYLTFERLEQKRMSYASKLQVGETCAGKPPSNLDLSVGATLSVRDAVLALIVKSANDVACAVGESLAGSEDKFAALMTTRARQIGMRATTFRNASGLPDPGQVTTARDMATLALRLAHDFPEHYKLFATREFTFNGHTHRSHNSLLLGFAGADGIKTGYTRSSGFNLVSSVRRGQKHVIGVVFGGVTAAQRNAHMRALLVQALGRAKAMASPVLVRRPALVPDPVRLAGKPPVPRRVAEAFGETTTTETPNSSARTAGAMTPARRRSAGGHGVSTPASSAIQAAARPVRPTAETPPAIPRAAASAPGRRPATLDEQASGRIAASRPAVPPSRLRAPAVAASARTAARPAGLGAPAPTGLFHVQIGAFSTAAEAQKQLAAISDRAGPLLAGHAAVTVPYAKANLQFYRARFAGFDETKAQAACQALKQQKIECVVMKAE